MYRTHHCGELRNNHINASVTLSGWVQTVRKFGSITFVDLRDRYGITQLVFGEQFNAQFDETPLGREFVLQVQGKVIERSNKNSKIPTGDIEIEVGTFKILNKAATPPFTIEENTDGGDELRMKYRFLDLRRPTLRRNMELRYKVNRAVRNYLDSKGFWDIETPFLIKSTPEGARDFVVPSRMNEGQFYALPQSPQTFKQLLMVSGYDRYYQIVKCFRDEDLRADRQPEFTQIDCEMAFVEQEDILENFEGLFKFVFEDLKGRKIEEAFPRMTFDDAMWHYGNDKPDIRFEMKIQNLKTPFVTASVAANASGVYCEALNGVDFKVTNEAESVLAICVPNASEYTRKQTDELTEWVKRPQIGMTGLLFIKCNADGTFKSSVDKFFDEEKLKNIAAFCGAKAGDLILLLAGNELRTRKAISELRLEMGNKLGYRSLKGNMSITNITTWVESLKKVYSMRIPSQEHSLINKADLISLVKKYSEKYFLNKIELVEIRDGKFEKLFGDPIEVNRISLESFTLRTSKNNLRTVPNYFIFTQGDSYAFSQLSNLRHDLVFQTNIMSAKDFAPLWVIDFPLFEYDEDGNRWVARHHPFTSPKPEQIEVMINNDPKIANAAEYYKHPYNDIKANAYDLVLNGTEIGGGSIRIFQRELQEKMFAALGMSPDEAQEKFGFLLGAFEYGAPPHGGIALGFDRLCALLGGQESIRDFIAFPKNNAGRDVMIDAPSEIDEKQFAELKLKLDL